MKYFLSASALFFAFNIYALAALPGVHWSGVGITTDTGPSGYANVESINNVGNEFRIVCRDGQHEIKTQEEMASGQFCLPLNSQRLTTSSSDSCNQLCQDNKLFCIALGGGGQAIYRLKYVPWYDYTQNPEVSRDIDCAAKPAPTSPRWVDYGDGEGYWTTADFYKISCACAPAPYVPAF